MSLASFAKVGQNCTATSVLHNHHLHCTNITVYWNISFYSFPNLTFSAWESKSDLQVCTGQHGQGTCPGAVQELHHPWEEVWRQGRHRGCHHQQEAVPVWRGKTHSQSNLYPAILGTAPVWMCQWEMYTEHQKKLITSSERLFLKSKASKLIIFGHRLAIVILIKAKV